MKRKRTELKVQRVHKRPTDSVALVEDGERDHVGVKDERSRVAQNDAQGDAEDCSPISVPCSATSSTGSGPKEFAASGWREVVATSTADDKRDCGGRSSALDTFGELGKNELAGTDAFPPKPFRPGNVDVTLKGMPVMPISPALVLAVTAGRRSARPLEDTRSDSPRAAP